MSNAFSGLEPALLWRQFEAICGIPRPSGHEQKISAWLQDWARGNGFSTRTDEVGNVFIYVPATRGMEGHPAVALQGHLDMVPEKNKDKVFDFETQGIQVLRDGDFLKADGTTLGADNGIGIAMALALAVEPGFAHGPLELLFTIEEETGLTGASGLKPGYLSSRMLINVDSEEEGYIFVGCAGGGDSSVTWSAPKSPAEGLKCRKLKITGLLGGHSGLTIHENRGNALKLLARCLAELMKTDPALRVSRLEGGDKHNAIPREAEAALQTVLSKAAIEGALAPVLQGFAAEFAAVEKNCAVSVEEHACFCQAWTCADSARLVNLLLALPHGVMSMSRDIPGLVESSTNLARIRTESETATILCSSRSSVGPALERVRDNIEAISVLSGAVIKRLNGYPGWKPDMKSPLLAHCTKTYKELSGKDAHVTAIHAGLECGIIGDRYPGMDMVSMGPDMSGVHSPDEKLSISSSARVYQYLKKVISGLGA